MLSGTLSINLSKCSRNQCKIMNFFPVRGASIINIYTWNKGIVLHLMMQPVKKTKTGFLLRRNCIVCVYVKPIIKRSNAFRTFFSFIRWLVCYLMNATFTVITIVLTFMPAHSLINPRAQRNSSNILNGCAHFVVVYMRKFSVCVVHAVQYAPKRKSIKYIVLGTLHRLACNQQTWFFNSTKRSDNWTVFNESHLEHTKIAFTAPVLNLMQ